MAIQIPAPQQQLQTYRSGTPLVRPQGQGALEIAKGIGSVSEAAQNISQNNDAALNAEINQQHRQQDAALAAQIDLEKKQTATDVLNAETQAQAFLRAQQTWAAGQTGTAARGATERAQTAIEHFVADTVDSPDNNYNDNTRFLIKQRLQPMINAHLDTIAAFEAKETTAALGDAARAKVSSMQDMAASNAGNPSAVKVARSAIIEANKAHALDISMPPEVLSEQMKSDLSKMHIGVVNNLAIASPEAAQKYFTDNKDEIDGREYDNLEKTLKGAADVTAAQTLHDSIMANPQLDWPARFKAAETGAKGEVRDKAIGLLESTRRRQMEQQAADLKELEKQGFTSFIEADRSIQTMQKNNPALYQKLVKDSPELIRTMQDLQKQPQDLILTDYPKFWNLMMEAAHDPETFMSENLDKYRNYINTKEFDLLIDAHTKIATQGRVGVTSVMQDIENATRNMTKEDAGNFTATAIEQLNAMKVPPSAKERLDILSQLRVKGPDGWLRQKLDAVKGYIFDSIPGSGVPAALGKGTSLGAASGAMDPNDYVKYKAIPAQERAQIEDTLQSRGVAPTSVEVLNQYNIQHNKPAKKD